MNLNGNLNIDKTTKAIKEKGTIKIKEMKKYFDVIDENIIAAEGSFIYSLHEDCEFNIKAFKELCKSLKVFKKHASKQGKIDGEILFGIFKIYSFTMRSIIAHYKENDLYKISNMKEIQGRFHTGEFHEIMKDLISIGLFPFRPSLV